MSKHTSHDAKEHEADPKSTAEETTAAENAGLGADQAEIPVSPENAGDEAGPGAGTEQEAPESIAALKARLEEANDKNLRKAAEFENFRKRMNREKQDAIDFANQRLLLDLIPVMDDFERAIKAAETSQKTAEDFESLYTGISMIEKRLVSQLENKWGLKRFDAAGETFDPNRHEAIMMEKSAEITDPVVQEDFLKGYTLKDRVVRSAKVKVLMPDGSPET
ncbi:protein GrpE [Spirochaetia bacterium]|nr:protein GrpE [Spirochaetia bacterium]